jgi:hypothetical protein
LLYGGFQSSGVGIPGLSDTWEWHQDNWSELTPGMNPGPLLAPAMVGLDRSTLLYGGELRTSTSSEFVNNTWSWDGTNWTQEVMGPEPRGYVALAYVTGGRAVMFGGLNISGAFASDETWLYSNGDWMEVNVPSPSGRSNHAMVYDAIHRYVIMAGGNGEGVLPGDTWTFRFETEGEEDESCVAGEDRDQDSLEGCEDPDCWGYCSPHCPPGTVCDELAPRCGDGSCNPALETLACPEDCQ